LFVIITKKVHYFYGFLCLYALECKKGKMLLVVLHRKQRAIKVIVTEERVEVYDFESGITEYT
jgi:hypothetical protein